jgi:hypothetical protein
MAVKALHRLVMAVLIVAALTLAIGRTAVAFAEPQVWDLENYGECMDTIYAQYQLGKITFQQYNDLAKTCCTANGGVWSATQKDCVAPPGDQQGSRQLPGNIQIPSDIGSAPVVTQAPPRPIQVPSDIATAPVATQAPDCPPDTNCVPPPG